jgi:signal transduction histidine kinase
VAVVEREHRDRIVYESEPRAAGIAAAAPDAETSLLALRNNPMFFMRRGGRSERGPAPASGGPGAGAPPPATETRVIVGVIEGDRRREGTFQTRVVASEHAHWQLLAQHRAGSLEAAVAAARRRSLALSSGVLGLLAVAIGLIVVSARRAARLAHQQVEFVAAVSHELRTPVSVIGAAAGNLADGIVADPARVKTYGQTIQNEARRLGETVERVLQLAGIMAGRSMPPDSLAPEALVDEALAACRHEIDAAGAEVVVDVPADLPPVAGDVVALRSAIQNLVSNAIKYGGDARWVRVSARATGQGPRGMVEIAVADRGLGIDADERRLIFDAFTRGRAATDRQIQGSGLGLNLVQRIAEAHGGSVSVSSEPGRGSTFTLRLPAALGVVQDGTEDAALRPLGSSR